MTAMLLEILNDFMANYHWAFEPKSDPFEIEGWDLLAARVRMDGQGFCGGAALYRIPQLHGMDRYVKIVTNFDDVLSIAWANEAEHVLVGPSYADSNYLRDQLESPNST